ncbi:MAG TPA: TSUP family transporter [Bacteroidota bacterium]|nr:TSUP family transporter [Bacteroidota bacterium]
MTFEVTPWMYPLLFAGGMLAGWVDAIAGGGGMVTIPILLGIGVPPQMVLGTNKFQASFGSFTAAYHYIRKEVVPLDDAWAGILFTLIGSALGTIAVQQIDPGVLNVVIPFLLLAIAVLLLLTPDLGAMQTHPRLPRMLFYLTLGLGLGFYDGFFGPGVGTFWAMAFVLGLGFTLTRATGYTKVMNFTSNIVSLLVFAIGGNILWAPGAVMAVGQIIGSRLGSGMVVKRGVRFIRPVFIVMVILTTLKLLSDRLL